MATQWYYICCDGHRTDGPCLFDTLFNFSKGILAHCKKCEKITELRLTFPYALEAGSWTYKVLRVCSPDKPGSWSGKDSSKVTFYPLLVAMEYVKNPKGMSGIAFWLPYWHTVETEGQTRKLRYGQWAPCLDRTEWQQFVECAGKTVTDVTVPSEK